MRWKPHVRFGERAGETDRLRSRHRAPVRLHLAGAKLDLCRQRVQQDTLGHRGRSGDPLYGVRRALRTRDGLLTERQWARIGAVFADDAHAAVETTWCVYQQLIDAYAHNDPQRGKTLLSTLIDLLRRGLPAGLEELAQLGRTLHRRRDDVLAYFTGSSSLSVEG
jgi:transposase